MPSTVYVPVPAADKVTVAVPSVAPKHEVAVEVAVPVKAAGSLTDAAIELDTQPAADVATIVYAPPARPVTVNGLLL